MPKKVSKALTPLSVKNAKAGRHADGDGLYLLVKDTGARSWVFRFMLHGKARDLGLSRCSEAVELLRQTGGVELSLAQARDIAAIYRIKVRAGIDPLIERDQLAQVSAAAAQAAKAAQISFKTVADSYLKANASSWRNAKHRQQWENTLKHYVYPIVGDIPVGDITTAHVLQIIEPMWGAKPETARRVRGRIETVLDAAKARGYRDGENPARWRGHIAQVLPARTRLSRGHHKAMAYGDVPTFLTKLRTKDTVAALALEFTILTACRTSEVLGATWAEVDLSTAIWTIPAERMKAAKEHRVPLSKRALEILVRLKPLDQQWLFPGHGKQLSSMAMAMLLRRTKAGVTVHGFRSSFRDWAAECTGYSHEVCEMALAHTIGNKVEAAYRRGDMFDKRRKLMADWAGYCAQPANTKGTITPIRRAG
jgi:integrase